MLGIGENGNVFGDCYIIWGYEVCSDVFVDGLCDLGMIMCESFVIECVEIMKGLSFIFVGCGLLGGVVNFIIKKVLISYNFGCVDVVIGIDEYICFIFDLNKIFIENSVVCLNVLMLLEDKLGCEGIEWDCNGF